MNKNALDNAPKYLLHLSFVSIFYCFVLSLSIRDLYFCIHLYLKFSLRFTFYNFCLLKRACSNYCRKSGMLLLKNAIFPLWESVTLVVEITCLSYYIQLTAIGSGWKFYYCLLLSTTREWSWSVTWFGCSSQWIILNVIIYVDSKLKAYSWFLTVNLFFSFF